jgi:hypothetical protein
MGCARWKLVANGAGLQAQSGKPDDDGCENSDGSEVCCELS